MSGWMYFHALGENMIFVSCLQERANFQESGRNHLELSRSSNLLTKRKHDVKVLDLF